MAQMPFSPCDDTSNCDDRSVEILRHIFGDTIDALVSGSDPDAIAASSNVLATMFSVFNSGVLIVGSLIVSYVAIMGTMNTANDGEAMGRNWSSVWTPVRIVSGGAMLLPTASGFSFIQLIVLMFALWGVGFANGTYKAGVAMGILSPNGVVQGVNEPGSFYGMRKFASDYVAVSYCARAANSVYRKGNAFAPSITMTDRPDKVETTDGLTRYSYYVKDRNLATNVGGGAPICGIMTLNSYAAQDMDDPTANALEQLRMTAQQQKINAALSMINEIEAWVRTWPTDVNQSGWNSVYSNRFNEIVSKYEDQVATALAASVTSHQSNVDSGITAFANALTGGGWANAGGWFQRVGLVRGQIMKVVSEPVGSIALPAFNSLAGGEHAKLFEHSYHAAINAIKNKANLQDNSAATSPQAIADLIPTNAKGISGIGSVREQIDAKTSSWINGIMRWSVDAATGAGQIAGCGTAGQMGGSLNRMKCIGDYLSAVSGSIILTDVALKTSATGLRLAGGAASSFKIFGTGVELSSVTDPIWDWVLHVPVQRLASLATRIEPLAFYFGVFLPSLPYTIFMIVVVGWILAVLQSIIAAPLWAVMHMTPDRTFVGSQSQGYLLLLSLFMRPALAILGLFAAVLVSDPIIDYIAEVFFAMRGAVVSSTGIVGAIAEFFTFAWWFMVFGLVLLPVLYMTFGLPQILPDQVLRWIGAGVSDLGETSAVNEMRGGMSKVGSSQSSAAKINQAAKEGVSASGEITHRPTPSRAGRRRGRASGDQIMSIPQGVVPQAGEQRGRNS